MLTLIYVALVFESAELQVKYLIYAFGWYFLAKVTEHYDVQTYFMLGEQMSGHALKHLFASFGILSLYLMKKSVTAQAVPSDWSSPGFTDTSTG